MKYADISELNRALPACNLCPRLRAFAEDVALNRRKFNQEYWGKPVPGFGDPKAKLLIVGLAPAAQGGNRTGRPFTGDETGKWVIGGLYELGLSNLREGVSRDDGLVLKGVFLTNAVSCAPPKNMVRTQEIVNCSTHLRETVELLRELKAILALGSVAFRSVSLVLGIKESFAHLKVISNKGIYLVGSYHPSPLNTRTGRLTWEEWLRVLRYSWELAN